MGFARVNLQIVGNAGLDQFLGVLNRVFEVYVVIARAMRDEQAPFQICRGAGDGKVFVAGCEFAGQAEVSLGVDRVVVMPVSDGSDGDAGAEAIGVRECVEGECASPTPAPPAETLGSSCGYWASAASMTVS